MARALGKLGLDSAGATAGPVVDKARGLFIFCQQWGWSVDWRGNVERGDFVSGGSGPESGPGTAASPPAPRAVPPRQAQKAANRGREEILKQDRLLAQTAAGTLLEEGLSGPLFVVDAYEGSAAVWDWLLRGGWHSVLWPLVGETLVQRLQQMPALRTVLVLDGLTYEEIAERTPAAIDGLREALASGRLEAANGAYSRPLGLAVSGESHVRQLYYGLRAVRESLGIAIGIVPGRTTATSFLNCRRYWPDSASSASSSRAASPLWTAIRRRNPRWCAGRGRTARR